MVASAGETDRDLAGRHFPRNCLPYNIIEFKYNIIEFKHYKLSSIILYGRQFLAALDNRHDQLTRVMDTDGGLGRRTQLTDSDG
jgi:hypothetical protein